MRRYHHHIATNVLSTSTVSQRTHLASNLKSNMFVQLATATVELSSILGRASLHVTSHQTTRSQHPPVQRNWAASSPVVTAAAHRHQSATLLLLHWDVVVHLALPAWLLQVAAALPAVRSRDQAPK
jgi:hypothetical protein